MAKENSAFILVAALGMTMFAAIGGYTFAASEYPKVERYPPYHETGKDQEPDRPKPTQQSEAVRDKQPCRNPESREESDLCAQWVAANAARRNTLWTERQFWIGILTALGLAVTIFLTHKAVIAAQESVTVAQNTANRQLRAYVEIRRSRIRKFVIGEFPKVRMEMVNTGQTPARKLELWARVAIGSPDAPEDFFGKPAFFDHPPSRGQVGAGQGRAVNLEIDTRWDDLMEANFAEGGFVIYVWGNIQYEDVFGEVRQTPFRLHSGIATPHRRFHYCEHGNEAT